MTKQRVYSFEKLEVWIKSKVLVRQIYFVTRKFPDEEKFGLVSQLRRSSVSVCSNLAEGSTRKSFKDQARFYEIAYVSLIEVLSHLIISVELKFINESDPNTIKSDIDSIGRMLHALRKYSLLKHK